MTDFPHYGAATGERYRINPDGTFTFENGTHYTREELDILRETKPGSVMIRNLHVLKKIFQGTIGRKKENESNTS